MNDDELIQVMQESGYTRIRKMPDGQFAAVMPLFYTHAIIYGINKTGYEDRWCYHSLEAATNALDAWDGVGEPQGWHRHPWTGRRRNVKTGEEWIQR